MNEEFAYTLIYLIGITERVCVFFIYLFSIVIFIDGQHTFLCGNLYSEISFSFSLSILNFIFKWIFIFKI